MMGFEQVRGLFAEIASERPPVLGKPEVGMLAADDASLNSVAAVRLLHPRLGCVLQVMDRLPNMRPAPLGSGSCTPQHLLLGREAGRFH